MDEDVGAVEGVIAKQVRPLPWLPRPLGKRVVFLFILWVSTFLWGGGLDHGLAKLGLSALLFLPLTLACPWMIRDGWPFLTKGCISLPIFGAVICMIGVSFSPPDDPGKYWNVVLQLFVLYMLASIALIAAYLGALVLLRSMAHRAAATERTGLR